MLNVLTKPLATVSGSAGLAILTTALSQHFSTRQSEVTSEICCWIILPVLISTSTKSRKSKTKPCDDGLITAANTGKRLGDIDDEPSTTGSTWVFALCLGGLCWYKAEIGEIGLLPIITPLLLLAERNLLRSDPDPSKQSSHSHLSKLSTSIYGTTIITILLTFFLSKWALLGLILSLLPVTALLFIYISLIPKTGESDFRIPHLNIEDSIGLLAYRVLFILIGILIGQIRSFGVPSGILLSSLVSGSAKAGAWYCTIQAAKHTSWTLAPLILTFTHFSTLNPFTESSTLQCILNILASLLTLTQLISFIPAYTRHKSALYTISLLSILPYIANLLAIYQHSTLSSSFDNSETKHPIEHLIESAHADFTALLARQSTTYTAAESEYRRRYKIEPPSGFSAWFNYAVSHSSPIIDDYDLLHASIAPLLKLSGAEIKMLVREALSMPDIDLWSCRFNSEQAETTCRHPWRVNDRHIEKSFNDLLGRQEMKGVLPDLEWLVNHLDEPRMLIPPLTEGDRTELKVESTDFSRKSTWQAVTKYCSVQSPNTTSLPTSKIETFNIPFVTDRESAMDLCTHPEHGTQHGLFISPSSFNLIESQIPVLSTGTPSTMSDILFPSPAYNESAFLYDEESDVDWEEKSNDLFWAGSTTGGFATDDGWRAFHRQRFIDITQTSAGKTHTYLRILANSIVPYASTFLNRKSFTTSFTSLTQCSPRTCHSQSLSHPPAPPSPPSTPLHSRLTFDIDGNGISGRFYHFLSSSSLPLKTTMLREWHDERLIPWVHFVPVSLGMGELPEVVGWLLGSERGRESARGIAEAGREWMGRGLRGVDRRLYVWRVLLEVARVVDVGRETM